ncbi:Hint domain-containing protein [Poseidonocella sp. HB161398]|uniref:Hint domain-containing protein n=1 Tax=Poseidonocella sp. HB161398 TaxID=2320855 RepID=UPI001486391F|nr:Hint domain-containing protein [Poseidonocella sp. HB161398]
MAVDQSVAALRPDPVSHMAGLHAAALAGPGGRLARDTRIETPAGPRLLRDLRIGEMVETQDRGPQEILWIGRSRISREELEAAPDRRPVRIRRGALGPGLPRRDLVVAPEHRLALSHPALLRHCRSATVLFPALALADGRGISALPPNRGWTFLQLLLPHHALLLAEGCASESLPGAEARDAGGALPVRLDGLPVAQAGPPLPAPALAEARRLWAELCARRPGRGAPALQTQSRRNRPQGLRG